MKYLQGNRMTKQDEIKYWYAQGIISVVVAVFCLNCY